MPWNCQFWIFNMLEEIDDSEDFESSDEEIQDNAPQSDGKYVVPPNIF